MKLSFSPSKIKREKFPVFFFSVFAFMKYETKNSTRNGKLTGHTCRYPDSSDFHKKLTALIRKFSAGSPVTLTAATSILIMLRSAEAIAKTHAKQSNTIHVDPIMLLSLTEIKPSGDWICSLINRVSVWPEERLDRTEKRRGEEKLGLQISLIG